jgi:hypothetical protein
MESAMRPAGCGRRAGGRNSLARLVLIVGGAGAGALTAVSSPASAYYDFGFYRFYSADAFLAPRPRKKPLPRKTLKPIAKEGPIIGAPTPAGPVQVVVSIADQRVAIYANGALFAQSAVSTGKKGHSTPTGVFSVLEKHRHHLSNIYSNAPMPYMQRLTWSGVALHAGELPGYPASHGCIRLSEDFAKLLWSTTRTGARVIVARSEIAPGEITHPRLTALSKVEAPVALDLRGAAGGPGELVRIANAAEAAPLTDEAKVAGAAIVEPGKVPAELKAPAPNRLPVSILVSRKTGKLQVRQAFKPLFEAPVNIRPTEQEWGTHIYTALPPTEPGAALRWSAFSMPTQAPPTAREQGGTKKLGNFRRGEGVLDAVPEGKPPQTAETVLELFQIPQEAQERLTDLMAPGATLIVSDSPPSQETAPGTDFIVLTR